MEILSEYGLFLAKIVTLVVAALILVSVIVSAAQRARHHEDEGELQVIRLNDQMREAREALEAGMLEAGRRRHWLKQLHRKRKKEDKKAASAQKEGDESARKRLFVLDFSGDIKASETASLRRCVSAVLGVAEPERDEVVVRLESPGGMVHSYGYAAAQLDRLRRGKLSLTVCVDKVAASGGYMMACVADRIVASPFAILGSIGVVAQLPNFHRLLKKNEVDFEVLTAGEHKRTLTLFGENTEKGRQKFREDLEDTHQLFKDYVSEHRPVVDIDSIATGEIWFGRRAMDVKLADELATSDQYLMDACENSDVLLVRYERRKSLPEKLGMASATALESALLRSANWLRMGRYQ